MELPPKTIELVKLQFSAEERDVRASLIYTIERLQVKFSACVLGV